MKDYWTRYYAPKGVSNKKTKSSWKSPIVLFEHSGLELTLRELIFSILIVGIMTFIGFFISDKIESIVNSDNLKYRQAVSLSSDEEFQHAIRTDVGFAFANGKLFAVKPITNKHVPGEFLSIRVEHQTYRMHTQVYTTTDSKGRVHTHVRHYWTWDTDASEHQNSPTIRYCGVEFPYDKFGYDYVPTDSSIHKTGNNTRDVVYVTKDGFVASIFAELKNGTIHDKTDLICKDIPEYREELVESHTTLVFWIMWGVLTGILVFAFYVADNYWLEDN